MESNAKLFPTSGSTVPTGHRTDPDRIARDFQGFVTDVEGLLKNAQHVSGEGVALARAKLEEKVAQAKVRLDAARAAAAEEAGRALAATGGYVRREPLKALGIAAAVGAAIALLLARR
ncbi:MAG TPA: DUF883 domain-containing protein [Burkholderiales bacterium]|nr:DUF883 domain-containing protein [Burkholderiales bacterium]